LADGIAARQPEMPERKIDPIFNHFARISYLPDFRHFSRPNSGVQLRNGEHRTALQADLDALYD
jgi:hypothetical protein